MTPDQIHMTASDVRIVRAITATSAMFDAERHMDEATGEYTKARAEHHISRAACTEDERKRADALLLALESGPSLGVVA